MATNKPDFSLGRIDTPDVGGGLLDFADRQQKQYQIGLSNAVEADKLLRDRQRFAREQELNARVDTEYNREIGLRTARQDLSKEFLANPYAAKFGSGKETTLLDKQVNDYVNGGGVINDDMARRLQAKYEEARPFREDATNALTSQMVLAGEDPTKAAQTGAALGSNLLSRVEQQAAVSANRKIEQDQYDEAAKRNKDALQLKFDIAKANQAGDKDKAELLFKQYQSIGGGGTGGGSSTASGLMETLGKIGPVDASSALAEGGPIDLARKAGYTESQIARAAGQSLDTDPTAWTWADNKLDTTMFTRNLGMQQPGSGLSKSINIRDIQAPTAEEWASIVPNRAGYRVVDYDPKRFLEGSKGVLPELFGKDTVVDKPLLSEAAKETTEKKTNNNFTDTVKSIETSKAGGDYSKVNKIGAMGAYQFTPDTLDYINKVTGKNVTKEEFLKNPAIQDEYFKELTNANKTVLSRTGIAPTDFNAWAAHNLGVGNVRNLLDTSTPAKDNLKSFIKSNLPEGQEPTKENYIKYYAPKFGVKYEDVVNKDNIKANPIEVANHKRLLDPKSVKDIDWSHPDSVLPADTVDSILSFNKDGNPTDNRLAEINSQLGANPAPTPENLALMDERSKLAPRSIGSKTMDYVDTLRRELIDPLGASGYVVGGIPKVGSMLPKIGGGLNKGFGKLSELLTPSTKPMVIEEVPKLLENLRPQGTPNWSGTGRIATDKLNGINADVVLGQAGNQGNKLEGALRNADEAKRLLEETPETKLANLNYFSNTSLNKLNLQAPVDARRLLNGAIEARKQGQIDDAKLYQMIQKIDETKLLSPRELMEVLDRIGFKR